MKRVLASALLGSLLFIPARASADGYEPPSPSALQSIRAQHGRKDWWFVTTDSARFLVRIREIDTQGLTGLKPKGSSERPPDAIGWSSIARIDERHSKFLAKTIQGTLYGALIGGTLPFVYDQSNGEQYAGTTMIAGILIGGWLGGLWGDRIVREDPIYISRTLIAPGAVPPAPRPAERADSSVASEVRAAPPAAAPPPAVTGNAAAGAPSASKLAQDPIESVFIQEACDKIRPQDRLRIQADFGNFDGQVERATADGLSGLRPHSKHGGAEAIPGLVTWDRIQRIDRAGSAAATGARRGAIVFGALGAATGLFAIAVASAAGSSSTEPGGSWIVIGAAGGAAGGALLGAAIGSAGTSWRSIYLR